MDWLSSLSLPFVAQEPHRDTITLLHLRPRFPVFQLTLCQVGHCLAGSDLLSWL